MGVGGFAENDAWFCGFGGTCKFAGFDLKDLLEFAGFIIGVMRHIITWDKIGLWWILLAERLAWRRRVLIQLVSK